MTHRVYIDGHVGTTGLRIRDWLAGREDLEVLTLPEEDRKDPHARREALRQAEVAVLCLPDEAAREAAAWAEDSAVRLLDASSAHRIDDAWVYGLPELTPDQRKAIRDAPRVSNPGCYASAFILATRPLVDAGLVEANAALGSGGAGRGTASVTFSRPFARSRARSRSSCAASIAASSSSISAADEKPPGLV